MDGLKATRLEARKWQIGPYLINLPADCDDTEAEAWKRSMQLVHEGRHQYAETYKMADYHWMIDGHQVALARSDAGGKPLPDTEEAARAVLAETQIAPPS